MSTKFGPTFDGKDFPSEMRRQLWPLCCGASIISGFKDAYTLNEEELSKKINETLEAIPDFQVYRSEKMKPAVTFLTLNNSQMDSPKIMKAIKDAGFVQFGEHKARGHLQGFFIRDDSKTWKVISE